MVYCFFNKGIVIDFKISILRRMVFNGRNKHKSLARKKYFPHVAFFLVGMAVTGLVDINMEINKRVRERQIMLGKVGDGWTAIQMKLMKKGCRGSSNIANMLRQSTRGEEKKLNKILKKIRPWEVYILEGSKIGLLQDGGVSSVRTCSKALLSLVDNIRRNMIDISVERVKLFGEKEKFCKFILLHQKDKVLIAAIDTEELINLSKIRDIRSEYLLGIYDFRDDTFVIGDEIPKNAKPVSVLLGLAGMPLASMKLIPRPGLKIVKVLNKKRLLVWGIGLVLTAQLIVFSAVLQKKNVNLEKSRRDLEEANRKLEELAITDGLTGLFNRRHFNKLFTSELRRARRFGRLLSCVFVDIDHFKKVNDTYGHDFGDVVLRETAQILKSCTREDVDIIARYGGEEFILLLPETYAVGAVNFAERLRHEIESKEYTYEKKVVRVTASFGVSTLQADIKQQETQQMKRLIFEADQALYSAKESGRNQVRHFGELKSLA